ncbi:MAG: restriction endonuclease [Acidimicrobiaceae bacterium]|nr:restriction endonuclease [Acidimicrobiaceae bacterium]
MADTNFYELLGLQPTATPEEIRAAYRALVVRVHPDSGGNDALFRQVNRAYEVLIDSSRREAYDRNGYVDQRDPQADAPAPGWRRTDNQPPTGQRTASPPGSNDDQNSSGKVPPKGGPTTTPPPGSVTPNAGAGANSSALRARAAANPSRALLVVGVLLLMFASGSGGARSTFLFFGFLATVIGFVGVLGRRKAAHRAANERADIVRIDSMTGTEFEKRLEAAFVHVGYSVTHVGGRGDFGADLVLELPGTRTVVQAKRWTNVVGPGAVQEVVGSRSYYDAQYAIVVTTSSFTKAAIELARSNNVELWDRSQLIEFLAAQDLGPPRKGAALLGDELRAGAPTALRGGLVVLATLLSASAAASKPRRKPRRRR